MNDIVIAFLTGVLGPLLIIVTKFYLDNKKKNKKDPLDDLLANSDLINAELNSILEEVDADRAWIAQFHNGAYYYPSGKSIKKFTIFYEQTADSVSKISSFFQGIPCSLYSRSLAHILNEDGLYIKDYKESDYHGLGSVGDTGGTRSSMYFPLYSFDQKPIGFLCADWVKRKSNAKPDDIELLKNKSYRVAGYLTNYLDNL
jgi:hypothetical protein